MTPLAINSPAAQTTGTLAARRRKTDTETMTAEKNGLRMKNEKTMKENRFSFFADPQKRNTESRHTFGTLPFARHTEPLLRKSQRAKSPDPLLEYRS